MIIPHEEVVHEGVILRADVRDDEPLALPERVATPVKLSLQPVLVQGPEFLHPLAALVALALHTVVPSPIALKAGREVSPKPGMLRKSTQTSFFFNFGAPKR